MVRLHSAPVITVFNIAVVNTFINAIVFIIIIFAIVKISLNLVKVCWFFWWRSVCKFVFPVESVSSFFATLISILYSMQVLVFSLSFSIINSHFCSMQLLSLMLLIIGFVFRYFRWWHVRITPLWVFSCDFLRTLLAASVW